VILQEVLNLLWSIAELERPPAFFDRSQSADELANAGAVDVVHGQPGSANLGFTSAENIAHRVTDVTLPSPSVIFPLRSSIVTFHLRVANSCSYPNLLLALRLPV